MKEIITITKIDDEGNVIDTSTEVKVIKEKEYSIYAVLFDRDSSSNWNPKSEDNLSFLRLQERYANDLLKMKGYLFLNEVYEMLGIEKDEAFNNIGWNYTNPLMDSYVDFGIMDVTRKMNREFVNGFRNDIILDFNPNFKMF